MPSNSEGGHPKNVANFQLLIEHLNTFGPQYNPSNPAISLAALNNKAAQAKTAQSDHRAVEADYNDATNKREELFHGLQPMSSRIVNALIAAGVDPLTLNDAKTILRQLRGKRAPVKKKKKEITPESPQLPETVSSAEEAAATHSVSHRSFDQVTENFSKLLQIVQSQPLYTPNESDITVTSLQTYVTELSASTAAVQAKIAGYTASLTQRDAVLYAPDTGILALAKLIKAYVKSVFGAKSPQYKAISGISFKAN